MAPQPAGCRDRDPFGRRALAEFWEAALDRRKLHIESPAAGPQSIRLAAALPACYFRDRSVSFLHGQPMKKGEATRQRIISRTANLLNTQGYLSTPVSEIMRVAGLQKGGIYRHFDSRAALTREAFEFAFTRMRDRLLQAVAGKESATEKLFALLEVGRNATCDKAFRGGCPIMNLAVESDDADPELRTLARQAMARLLGLVEDIIADGTRRGEFAAGDARARAIWIVASLEGAIMLSNLYRDRTFMEAVIDHLRRSIENGFR